MKKARFVFVAVATISMLLIQPMATSQAKSPTTSLPSSINNQTKSTPWSFGQPSGGSPNERKSHDGVYYPTRDKVAAATPAPWGVGAVTYHDGGTVITNPNVYVIWYGNWNANSCSAESGKSSTPSILKDLLKNIGESDWNKINTTYYQKIGSVTSHVQQSVHYSGCTVDSGSQGLSLDAYDSNFNTVGPQVSDVVDNALVTNKLPTDPNGVYFVFTSKDVTVADFLVQFCAYHSSYVGSTTTINYAFVGDATNALALCAPQTTSSPNNNPAADAMASVAAHELVEAISDPQGASWYDEAGYENADKCAWIFGTATKAENGSFMNMSFGDREYLIQQNVAANTNICVSELPEASSNSQSHSEIKTPSTHRG